MAHLSPENTSYRYQGWVRWKGDLLTSEYEAHTDCSGFISSLLERADCSMDHRLTLASSRGKHPKAEDYFNLILKQDGFKRIDVMAEILPGDIIAVKYNVGNPAQRASDSGHVMLIDAIPVPRQNTKPVISGTKQWELSVIDSSKGVHGKTDTRYRANRSKQNGVGRGVLRLYSSEDGKVIGYSWSTLKNSVYYDNSSHPLVIGRVLCYDSQAAATKDAPAPGAGH